MRASSNEPTPILSRAASWELLTKQIKMRTALPPPPLWTLEQWMTLAQLNRKAQHDLQPSHPLSKPLGQWISGSMFHFRTCGNVAKYSEANRKAMSDMILNWPSTLPTWSPSWQSGKMLSLGRARLPPKRLAIPDCVSLASGVALAPRDRPPDAPLSAKGRHGSPKFALFLEEVDPLRHFSSLAEGGGQSRKRLTSALFWPSANCMPWREGLARFDQRKGFGDAKKFAFNQSSVA